MSYPGSFSGDQAITVFWLVALAVGIGQIMWGSSRHRQAFSRPPGRPRGDQPRLWQQLLTWQVVPPSYTAPAELEEFACSRDFIRSTAVTGSGMAIALASMGGAGIALVATRSWLSLLAANGYVFVATLLFTGFIGYSLGYVYGVRQLRALTAGKVTYGDLQPRRLADYRSALFPWIAGIQIADGLLLPLILAPHLGPQEPLVLMSGASVLVPVWILEALPAAMLLTAITGEVVMTRIARLPRLLLIANPQTARRADNLLRALTIGRLQGLVFMVIGYLGVAQLFGIQQFFVPPGAAARGWQPDAILFLLPWFFYVIGPLLSSLTGRLGGDISGWPWQPVRNA